MAEKKRTNFLAWTAEEDKILADGVAAGKTTYEIAELLPHRTREGVRHRKVHLNLRGKPQVHNALKWKEEEDAIIRQGAAENWPMEKYLEALQNRTQNAIYYRAKALELPPIKVKYHETRSAEFLRKRQQINRPKQWDEMMADWAERKCLTCGVMFMSWGKGNRLCIAHRAMSMGMD